MEYVSRIEKDVESYCEVIERVHQHVHDYMHKRMRPKYGRVTLSDKYGPILNCLTDESVQGRISQGTLRRLTDLYPKTETVDET